MRILMVNDTINAFGGAEQYLHNLKRLLETRGYVVGLFGRDSLGNMSSYLTRIYDPLSYWRLLKKIDEFKPDIVHFHGISRSLSPSVLRAARKREIPVVQTAHDFHIVCPKTRFMFKDGKPCSYGLGVRCLTTGCVADPYNLFKTAKVVLHRKIMRGNVDIMIAPSQILADWLKSSAGFQNVRVLPNFVEQVEQTGQLSNTKEILFAGRLTPEKGVKCLIEAMPKILENIGDAHLCIIGEGPEAELLSRLASELKINSNITFTGWLSHEEMESYIDSACVFCVPSTAFENSPLVVLEMITRKKPIVASNIGGIPELIEDGVNGYLVEPGNSIDLAEKIVAILSDYDLASAMSDKAGVLAEKYGEDNHFEKLKGIYGDMVS